MALTAGSPEAQQINKVASMSVVDDDPATYSKVPTSQHSHQSKIAAHTDQKQNDSLCRNLYYLLCEVKTCSRVWDSKIGSNFGSLLLILNMFAFACIVFGVAINDLTPSCGWNMDKDLEISFAVLCSDDTQELQQEYCEAYNAGIIWLIGNVIGLILYIFNVMVQCHRDTKQKDVKDGKIEKNPIPVNLMAFLSFFCGLVLIVSAILFETSQTVCTGEPNSSLILSYGAGGMSLTFGVLIFPLLAVMFCIFV